MKKVITPVGTSLFENYLKDEENSNFLNAYVFLKENKLSAEDLNNEKGRRRNIENCLDDNYFKNNPNASAEIKSLRKLKQEIDEEFEIYFLYSDTALSRLSAEILKGKICLYNELEASKLEIKKIGNLQVWNREDFNVGMVNLINTIYKIAEGYWDNVIINITGGYKATIPYLTILGQVNRCPIYYIFEDTDSLIKIPYIPIDIKWDIFEKHNIFFRELEKKGIKELPKGLTDEERNDISSLLERADDFYSLNPLGMILWEKFKETVEMFYISDIVKNYINENNQKKTIFEKSIIELKRRLNSNPNDPDLDHRIAGFDNREGFKCFKHKENNLQVRVLYKVEEWETTYRSSELDIYIGNVAIGGDVHNVETEYVEKFKNSMDKIADLSKYSYEILKTKEV